jgi:hypothetical protein
MVNLISAVPFSSAKQLSLQAGQAACNRNQAQRILVAPISIRGGDPVSPMLVNPFCRRRVQMKKSGARTAAEARATESHRSSTGVSWSLFY